MNAKRGVLLWLFYGVLIALPFLTRHDLPGTRERSSAGAVLIGVLIGLAWTLITWLLFRLADRLPFKRGQWVKPAIAHVTLWILCATLHAIAFGIAAVVVTGTPAALVDWEIEPAAQDAAVPSMILQPLAENALRHGIGKKVKGGHIRVRIAVANGRLNIAIEDDGPGFPSEWSPGVGLANVQNRLALHFGERASFETSTGPGASVRLSIPYTRMNGNAEVHTAHRR